jgi:hypothetical protein
MILRLGLLGVRLCWLSRFRLLGNHAHRGAFQGCDGLAATALLGVIGFDRTLAASHGHRETLPSFMASTCISFMSVLHFAHLPALLFTALHVKQA